MFQKVSSDVTLNRARIGTGNESMCFRRPAGGVHDVPPAEEVPGRAVRAVRGRAAAPAELPEALPRAPGARLAPAVGRAHRAAQVPRRQRGRAAAPAQRLRHGAAGTRHVSL